MGQCTHAPQQISAQGWLHCFSECTPICDRTHFQRHTLEHSMLPRLTSGIGYCAQQPTKRTIRQGMLWGAPDSDFKFCFRITTQNSGSCRQRDNPGFPGLNFLPRLTNRRFGMQLEAWVPTGVATHFRIPGVSPAGFLKTARSLEKTECHVEI